MPYKNKEDQQAYLERNKQRLVENRKNYRKIHRERLKQYQKEYRLKKKDLFEE